VRGRRRAQWKTDQGRPDPRRLVFVDETGAKTDTTPPRGWPRRGSELVARKSRSPNERRWPSWPRCAGTASTPPASSIESNDIWL